MSVDSTLYRFDSALYSRPMTDEQQAVQADAAVEVMDAMDLVAVKKDEYEAAMRVRDEKIRAALDAGISQQDLARMTKFHPNRIGQIKRGTRT